MKVSQLEDEISRQLVLDKCEWPDLAEPYASALREAVTFIVSRFDILAVVVSGTIIRGRPDNTSDLDIVVLHPHRVRQRLQKRFAGVPAEIFVNPPHAVERYLTKERDRPMTAHMLATGFVIYAGDPVIHTLRQQAMERLQRGPSYTEADLTRARYSAATWFEDALDVVERDPATAQMLLSQAVFEMLRFSFLQRQMYVPRQKDLMDAVTGYDPDLGSWARSFFVAPELDARLELAGRIADRIVHERGFFEWESAVESV